MAKSAAFWMAECSIWRVALRIPASYQPISHTD